MDILLSRTKGGYLATMQNGKPFHPVRFRNVPWTKAFRATDAPYRRPYAMRHTFASWALVVGVHPSRVVALMGHSSKQMVYEVYARYTEGVELDAAEILGYLGQDFRSPEKTRAPIFPTPPSWGNDGESSGES